MPSTINRYQIWDLCQMCFVSAPYKCPKRARTRADKLDLEYGGYRYSVKTITPMK